jgi:hypothetical protein
LHCKGEKEGERSGQDPISGKDEKIMIRSFDSPFKAKPTHVMFSTCLEFTFRRVLKTAVLDSTQEFRLEKEILETR